MPRGKGKGNLKTFVFSIDADDVKYQDLINYLESIDNGARSYVIRQILNSYIGNQCVIPPNTISSTPVETVSSQKEEQTPVIKNHQVSVSTEKSEKSSHSNSNRVKSKSFVPNKIKPTQPQETVVKEENKGENITKPEISDGMSKLLQNFQ